MMILSFQPQQVSATALVLTSTALLLLMTSSAATQIRGALHGEERNLGVLPPTGQNCCDIGLPCLHDSVYDNTCFPYHYGTTCYPSTTDQNCNNDPSAVCVNSATGAKQDEGCPAQGTKICVLADGTEPDSGDDGDQCVKCINNRSDDQKDRGCGVNNPICISSNGSEPLLQAAGVMCARCSTESNNCDANASCQEDTTDGSFSCICNEGYTGDGLTCANMDECLDGSHNCDENASCQDTDGSFTCSCNHGYFGDGISSCAKQCFNGHEGDLIIAVDNYFKGGQDKHDVIAMYGEIKTWCFADTVTHFYFLFAGRNLTGIDFSEWDVSSVTDMGFTFTNATFSAGSSHGIDQWDVSNVENMVATFWFAHNFFGTGIENWNVSSVRTMNGLFEAASAFKTNLCVWGDLVDPSTSVSKMFHSTACTYQMDPNLTANTPGPFCHVC